MREYKDTYEWDENNIPQIDTKIGLQDFLCDIYLTVDDKSYDNVWHSFSTLCKNGKVQISAYLIDDIINDKRVTKRDTILDRFNTHCDNIIKGICDYIPEEEIMS